MIASTCSLISVLQIFEDLKNFGTFWLKLHCYKSLPGNRVSPLQDLHLELSCQCTMWPGEEERKDDKLVLFPDC